MQRCVISAATKKDHIYSMHKFKRGKTRSTACIGVVFVLLLCVLQFFVQSGSTMRGFLPKEGGLFDMGYANEEKPLASTDKKESGVSSLHRVGQENLTTDEKEKTTTEKSKPNSTITATVEKQKLAMVPSQAATEEDSAARPTLQPIATEQHAAIEYDHHSPMNKQTFSPELQAVLGMCPSFLRPFEDWKGPDAKPNVYQLSAKFGHDKRFELQVKQHWNLSLETGIFDPDKIFEYYELPDFILNDPVFENHTQFVTNPRHRTNRGGGYWFWKHTLIYHHLQQINPGDFLVYCDNDVLEHWKQLARLLQTMIDKDKNFATTPINPSMSQFTKRDVDEAYCHRTSQPDNIEQYDAMFTVLRKDDATMQFMYQVAEGAKDYHIITDEPSRLPNFDFFKVHRRDQSIQNAVMNCRYGAPEKEHFLVDENCSYIRTYMYKLPVWEESTLLTFMNDTENAFRLQKKLQDEASEVALANPYDPYWKSYLQTGKVRNETYWKLLRQFKPVDYHRSPTTGQEFSPELQAVLRTCPSFLRPFEDWKGPDAKPNVYQLSGRFGNDKRIKYQVKQHWNLSLETGIFDPDKIFEYYELPDFILNDPVFENHTQFLTNPRHETKKGGGYWFWRPTLIYHHLQQINPGDFLVYCDVGVLEQWKQLGRLLQTMIDKDKNFATIPINPSMSQFTKRDVDEAYCHRTSQPDNIEQHDAMFTVLRKDDATMQFMYQVAEGAKDYHTITDEPSRLPNFDFFKDHRWDQSIQNAVMNCRYGAPEKERFRGDRNCTHRAVYMYKLPVWEESTLLTFVNDTENAFRLQKKLQDEASEVALANPYDPYWKSYLQTGKVRNETYWKLPH